MEDETMYVENGGGDAQTKIMKKGTTAEGKPGKIMVHGLPLTNHYSDEDLKELFIPYGRITEVNLIVDHKKGTSRGFGFVTFENHYDALDAMDALNGTDVGGKSWIHCQKATLSKKAQLQGPTSTGAARGKGVVKDGSGTQRGGTHGARGGPSQGRGGQPGGKVGQPKGRGINKGKGMARGAGSQRGNMIGFPLAMMDDWFYSSDNYFNDFSDTYEEDAGYDEYEYVGGEHAYGDNVFDQPRNKKRGSRRSKLIMSLGREGRDVAYGMEDFDYPSDERRYRDEGPPPQKRKQGQPKRGLPPSRGVGPQGGRGQSSAKQRRMQYDDEMGYSPQARPGAGQRRPPKFYEDEQFADEFYPSPGRPARGRTGLSVTIRGKPQGRSQQPSRDEHYDDTLYSYQDEASESGPRMQAASQRGARGKMGKRASQRENRKLARNIIYKAQQRALALEEGRDPDAGMDTGTELYDPFAEEAGGYGEEMGYGGESYQDVGMEQSLPNGRQRAQPRQRKRRGGQAPQRSFDGMSYGDERLGGNAFSQGFSSRPVGQGGSQFYQESGMESGGYRSGPSRSRQDQGYGGQSGAGAYDSYSQQPSYNAGPRKRPMMNNFNSQSSRGAGGPAAKRRRPQQGSQQSQRGRSGQGRGQPKHSDLFF